mmetsp:Transcript_17132/g.39562  ORF Transcript_17132/g.39562 Transcript_17132/m.39562 type:complete len:144 (+) Transcript_17132:60-491(+)
MMSFSMRCLRFTGLIILGTIGQCVFIHAFLPASRSTSSIHASSRITSARFDRSIVTRMSDRDDENDDNRSRLRDLGFSEDEIERSERKPVNERRKVRIDMVDNVDATTITAVGFGLIAFNFFVLANLGDGGIGGIVATIINSF